VRHSQLEVPSLLIQPIVENVVKHGISGLGAAGILEVTFKIGQEDLLIIIRDNGPGFDINQQPRAHEWLSLLQLPSSRQCLPLKLPS